MKSLKPIGEYFAHEAIWLGDCYCDLLATAYEDENGKVWFFYEGQKCEAVELPYGLAHVIRYEEMSPKDLVTVSYPEDAVEEYWEEAEAEFWKTYDEMEAEAEIAADDLLALDLEDKLTKTRRRLPFLMPKGWSIEYIWH